MLHLPSHLALVLLGLGLVLLRLETGALTDLPAWVAPSTLVLLVPARWAAARVEVTAGRLPRRALALGSWATPLVVLAASLFLTRLPAEAQALAPAWASWVDLAWLPLLLPLLVAHLGLVLGRPQAGPWRPGRPLALSWAIFVWSALGLYLVLATLVGRSGSLLAWVETTTLGSLVFTGLLLAVMLVLVPRLLLLCLDTVPPPAAARRLAEAPRFGDVGFRLFEWRTGDELSNAMVLAMPFGPRPVLFTDGFLARLTRGEFEAVLAHELGHVRRRHVSAMAAWVLGAALAFDLATSAWLPAEVLDGARGIALALAFLVLVALAIGWLSRRLELEADLSALEVTGDWRGLARVLALFGGTRRRRATWRHFSPRERILFLRAASRDPGVGARLHRSLRPLRLAGLALLVAALGLTLVRALGDLPTERVWVDLRQGDLIAASARYGELEDDDRAELPTAGLDPGYFEDLLELGARLQSDAPLDLERLGAMALEQARAEGHGAVVQLIDLALFVDPHAAPGLWQLRAELVARVRDEEPARPLGDPQLPGAWALVRAVLAGE